MAYNRPPIDEGENLLDAAKLGAKSTTDVFEHKQAYKKLKFIMRIWSE
jgi:hypothetical protein